MAKMINSSLKEKLLTVIRSESQGFLKVCAEQQQALLEVANSAKFVHVDSIINNATSLLVGIGENVDKLDETLTQIAELYIKQGVLEETFQTKFKQFIDERTSLVPEYELAQTQEGEGLENYLEQHGNAIVEALNKLGASREQYLVAISEVYKPCAGEDIADMIVPAFKAVEESCNEFIVEVLKVVEAQAALDARLLSVANGVNDLATSMKMNSVAEKKIEFGAVSSSSYVGDDL